MKKNQLLFLVFLSAIAICNLQAQTEKDFRKFSRYIQLNKTEKVLSLIEKGKNVNSRNNLGITPLLFSLQNDKIEFANLFINKGADINVYDNQNNGCLHYSIQYCTNKDIIYKLIDLGADISHKNSEMYTPFHTSVLYKCPEMPFFLIEKGADYKLITGLGENAIHLSAESGCDSLLEFSLQQGLDYNLADQNGNTPFLIALMNDRRSITKKLISSGADYNVKNNKNQTPMFFAINNNDTLIFDFLIDKGANANTAADGIFPINLAASNENKYFVEKLLLSGIENPMKCDTHDLCYQTAFIYSVSAGIANENDKLGLLQNSLSIYNLAEEKYKTELNKIRAKNTAKVCGQGCLFVAGAATGSYYYVDPLSVNYETERRNYLNKMIEKCEIKTKELQTTISSLK